MINYFYHSSVVMILFCRIYSAFRNFMHLGLGLRFVLDAIRKPHGSNMYYFGIAALDKFKSKLKEYPKYCEHLASIPHFADFPPHLIEVSFQYPPHYFMKNFTLRTRDFLLQRVACR